MLVHRFILAGSLGIVAFACGGTPNLRPRPVSSGPSDAAPRARVAMVSTALRQDLDAHCTSCHDESHRIDLKHPPASSDRAFWENVQEALSTSKMPPLRQTIGVSDRARMVQEVGALFWTDEPPPPKPEILGPHVLRASDWLAVVHDVGDASCGRARIDGFLGEHFGGFGGLRQAFNPPDPKSRGEFVLPLGQVERNRIAFETCRCVSAKEFVEVVETNAGSRGNEARARSVSSMILKRTFQVEPTTEEIDASARLFQAVVGDGGSSSDATIAVCTATLAGPRALHSFLHEGGTP